MTNFNIIPDRRKNINFGKWTFYPKDILPMWLADMDFPAPKAILDALHKKIEHGVLGYEWPSRKFYEVIAERMKNLYGWDVNPDSILYTAGVNNGYNIAARVLCGDKKGYVIQTPVYNEFHDMEKNVNIPKRVAPLAKVTHGNRLDYEVDFDALKKAVRGAGMFLLCHPHNPVGKVFSGRELRQMAKICIENKVPIVSDEIHAEMLLGNSKFTPLASLSKEIAKNTITLISASKSCNVPGLSAAFAIIPDEKMRKQFFEVGFGMSYEVSSLGLTASQVAFSGKADSWLKELRRHLTANRDFLVNYVSQNMPNVRTTIPDATYLGWLDFTETGIEKPFEFFLENAKVAFSDGKIFGKGGEGHVRINFGTSRAILKEGLEKMSKAMKSIK
jgi:cysteine-S-conjugate beta-lyase